MYFPTTRWTLLAHATLSGETTGRSALDYLCRHYWKPLAIYIQMRGYSPTEAEDLTQEFILHIMQQSTLSRASRERGKFRTFLLGSLNNFLNDARDKHLAQKRGGRIEHESIDSHTDAKGASTAPNDCSVFDREWALVILESALNELRAEFSESTRFEVLQRFLPGAIDGMSYEAAAERIGISVPAVKAEIHRIRQNFRILVRQQILATVDAPHEVDDEMEYLGRVLMDRGSDLSRKLSAENS